MLGLKSFLDNNHEVVLWSYEKPKNLIDGVIFEDANQILDSKKIFLYDGNGDCRKNSCGGFSDLFRYYLLDKVGGWYCDTDVTCLNNFEELDKSDYVFRPHTKTLSVANIIKCPKDTNFIKQCIRDTETQVKPNNDAWIKPLIIFSNNVLKFKLEKYIVSNDYFGLDNDESIKNLIDINYYNKKFQLPKYAIHWCNEAISRGTWNYSLKRDMQNPIPTTLYYKLLKKHNLISID